MSLTRILFLKFFIFIVISYNVTFGSSSDVEKINFLNKYKNFIEKLHYGSYFTSIRDFNKPFAYLYYPENSTEDCKISAFKISDYKNNNNSNQLCTKSLKHDKWFHPIKFLKKNDYLIFANLKVINHNF